MGQIDILDEELEQQEFDDEDNELLFTRLKAEALESANYLADVGKENSLFN